MAYRLTGSPLMLGVVGFFGQAPTPLIAPFAGVLVDRWDRRRTILVMQISGMLQSVALATLALTGAMAIWHLIVLGAAQAVINAFDMPARQSFMGQMIDDRRDLPNAIALNASIVNGGRLVGPALAAVLVDRLGEAACFSADAASYLAVIGSLLMMRVDRRPARPRAGRVLAELADGVRYAGSMPLVRGALILLAVSSALGGAYATLLPIVATSTLHGGPRTLGVLMASAGCGALTGALYLAGRNTLRGVPVLIGRCVFGLGIGMVALELVTTTWIAVLPLFVIGLTMVVQIAATNTLVQSLVDDHMLGRVISLHAVAFVGGAPVGALLEGALADQIGAIHTFGIAGVLCLVTAAIFASALPGLLRASRPLYARLGLADDEPATG
jgi:MFS family permease